MELLRVFNPMPCVGRLHRGRAGQGGRRGSIHARRHHPPTASIRNCCNFTNAFWVAAGSANNLLIGVTECFASALAYTALVLATLTLGIGANSAIFSLVYGALLRPLPYPAADRLVHIAEWNSQSTDMAVSRPDFQDQVLGPGQNFSALSIFRTGEVTLKTPTGSELVSSAMVSTDFFQVLGVHAAIGRDMTADDDRVGAAPVAWLTEKRLGPLLDKGTNVVGKTIMLDGAATTVVGILPASFRFFRSADAFTPIEPFAEREFFRQRGNHSGTYVIGRLKPGIPVGAARAQITAIQRRLESQYPRDDAGIAARIEPSPSRLEGDSAAKLSSPPGRGRDATRHWVRVDRGQYAPRAIPPGAAARWRSGRRYGAAAQPAVPATLADEPDARARRGIPGVATGHWGYGTQWPG